MNSLTLWGNILFLRSFLELDEEDYCDVCALIDFDSIVPRGIFVFTASTQEHTDIHIATYRYTLRIRIELEPGDI